MTPGQFAAAAGNVADDIGPRVSGAASSTRDKVNDTLPSGVKNAAGSVSERANIAGTVCLTTCTGCFYAKAHMPIPEFRTLAEPSVLAHEG